MFLSVLIGAMVSGDGRSNWYKGVQLITVYVIMAFLFYLMPDAAPQRSAEFAENWGRLLNFFVFFLFGLLVARVWINFNFTLALYAILSLTVVRMIPVALALAGTGLSRSTVLFVGWFGPRGLVSIVLGLVYLEQHANLPGEPTIRLAVMATVLLSIFAHGLSALPGTALYAKRIASLDSTAPEYQPIGEQTAG
jgi:sodium/hydrogen antiporter